MSTRVFGSLMAMAAVVAVLSLAPVPVAAEASGGGGQAPRAVAKTWDPPRTPDGKPDLQGYWQPEVGTSYSIENLELQEIFQGSVGERIPDPRKKGASRIVDPSDGKIPYQPWAAAKRNEIFEHHLNPNAEQIDPQARCYLSGVPRPMYLPTQYQILQPQGQVVILYESNHTYRSIPLDGRPHIGKNIQLWMGDSRGRWEGDTLVVDATHFNGKVWFDIIGDFQSDALHVVERFTLVNADRIEYQATIEDPKLYTRPWKMAIPIVRIKEPGYQLMEYACYEGNRAPGLMLAR